MRIPPICNFGSFGMRYNAQKQAHNMIPPLKNDTIHFTSEARYYREYVTLPSEIRQILSPKDGVDMFKEMEYIASGLSKGHIVGKGDHSQVYQNPWLKGFGIAIIKDPNSKTQIIYSAHHLGDSVWQSKTRPDIQIIKIKD